MWESPVFIQKRVKVQHQRGDKAGLQSGGVRGQCPDEGWPAANVFGLKKKKEGGKNSLVISQGWGTPHRAGKPSSSLRSSELRTFQKYKELLIMFCLVGTSMINSVQALLVQ